MNEAVTDVIVARARESDGLLDDGRLVAWRCTRWSSRVALLMPDTASRARRRGR